MLYTSTQNQLKYKFYLSLCVDFLFVLKYAFTNRGGKVIGQMGIDPPSSHIFGVIGTVSVISCEPLCKKGHSQFPTVPTLTRFVL